MFFDGGKESGVIGTHGKSCRGTALRKVKRHAAVMGALERALRARGREAVEYGGREGKTWDLRGRLPGLREGSARSFSSGR